MACTIGNAAPNETTRSLAGASTICGARWTDAPPERGTAAPSTSPVVSYRACAPSRVAKARVGWSWSVAEARTESPGCGAFSRTDTGRRRGADVHAETSEPLHRYVAPRN